MPVSRKRKTRKTKPKPKRRGPAAPARGRTPEDLEKELRRELGEILSWLDRLDLPHADTAGGFARPPRVVE